MARPGFVSHIEDSRRAVAWLVACYVVGFQLVGGLAGILIIGLWDPANTLLANPAGYFLRYGLPMAGIALAVFWNLYRKHAGRVTDELSVRLASRLTEPRLMRVAEEQCTAAGIGQSRIGVVEAPQPNALTVGVGPEGALIVVTRGLLDELDDEELAAVLAHEAAHIRNGDTRVLAANYALMRTAVLLQVNNPLRFEDWRQLLVPLFLPPFMLIMLLSGFITMCSMKLAREARRGINLSRDFIADAEAVRATHFPDALISALRKLNGRGAFAGSASCEDLLFEGRSSGDGGSHPEVAERIAAIAELSGTMIDAARVRRDSRPASAPAGPVRGFGRRGLVGQPALALAAPTASAPRIREKPEVLDNGELLKLWLTDNAAYRSYVAKMTDFYEWREGDDRNFLGIRSELTIPVAAVFAFLAVLHWPANGDLGAFAYKFSPQHWADIGQKMNSGPFCSGLSYPDGKCASR